MSDLRDFFSTHPVPEAPVKTDPVPRVRTARSMNIVDRTVCRAGCTEHEHVGPVFTPDPELDEVGVGWTVQHMPSDPNRHKVPQRCVLCWAVADDLAEHECEVLALVSG